MLKLREVRKAPSVWFVVCNMHQENISIRELEMCNERLQKLREIGTVACICLLLPHCESQKVGFSLASASKEGSVRGKLGSLRTSVMDLCCRPTCPQSGNPCHSSGKHRCNEKNWIWEDKGSFPLPDARWVIAVLGKQSSKQHGVNYVDLWHWLPNPSICRTRGSLSHSSMIYISRKVKKVKKT